MDEPDGSILEQSGADEEPVVARLFYEGNDGR